MQGVDIRRMAIQCLVGVGRCGQLRSSGGEWEKTVRIFAPVEGGEPDVTGVRAKKEMIAPNFNTKSTIVVEISPADGNEFNFEVKSR